MQRDILLLTEMIDAAEQAQQLTADVTVSQLEADRNRRDALLWNFTVSAVGDLMERHKPNGCDRPRVLGLDLAPDGSVSRTSEEHLMAPGAFNRALPRNDWGTLHLTRHCTPVDANERCGVTSPLTAKAQPQSAQKIRGTSILVERLYAG